MLVSNVTCKIAQRPEHSKGDHCEQTPNSEEANLAQWVRLRLTKRKVAGSIPANGGEFFSNLCAAIHT